MKVQTRWTQPQMPTFALEKDLKNCQEQPLAMTKETSERDERTTNVLATEVNVA
jgi:hypothetical protein